MSMVRIVIFDFDGTLFDTAEAMVVIFRKSFQEVGMDCTEEEARHYMHQSLQETIMERRVPKESIQPFVEAILRYLDCPEANAVTRPFPETKKALSLLESLHIPMGVVTGNTVSHARGILAAHGMDGYFSSFVGSDVCEAHKPDPEPLMKCLEAWPEEMRKRACYIGDSLQDTECASRALLPSVLIERTPGEYKDYQALKATNLIDALELLGIPANSASK